MLLHTHTQGIYEDVLHELYQRGEGDGEERRGEVEGGGVEEGGGEMEGGGEVEGISRGNMGAVEADILAVMRDMHANVSRTSLLMRESGCHILCPLPLPQKVTVKPHYFYSLLAHHSHNNNFEGRQDLGEFPSRESVSIYGYKI